MAVGYRQGISIGVLIFYIPALAIAILLSIRHGFTKASGWRFMIIFTLARVLGSCLDLATISQPRNYSLYIGYATLINIALSPLELVGFGLLSRVITSINRGMRTVVTPRHIKLAELLITVGLILSIVGGVNAGTEYGKTGIYKPQTLSKVGLALFIAAFAILSMVTGTLLRSIQHAEAGEKRILVAVAASLPFLLVRLIYSILAVFANDKSFSSLSGSVTVLLCMALLEEIIVVIMYEGVGLTLRKEKRTDAIAQAHRVSGEHLMQGKPDDMEFAERREGKLAARKTPTRGPIGWAWKHIGWGQPALHAIG